MAVEHRRTVESVFSGKGRGPKPRSILAGSTELALERTKAVTFLHGRGFETCVTRCLVLGLG